MRSGIFGDRVGWMRRRIKNGRHAWGPGNPDDSFLVGATRMDSVGLIPSEQTRMFFDKATGAFRVGIAASTQWDTLGTHSVAIGGTTSDGVQGGAGPKATGIGAVAIGATGNATGSLSLALGAGDTFPCTASGNGAVAIGYNAQATGLKTFAVNTGDYAATSATATVTGAVAIGGGAVASATAAMSLGYGGSATRYGQHARGGSGPFASTGDAQFSRFIMRKSTADGTATELALDGGTTYLTIGATRTMSFHIKLAAHRTDVSGTAAAWPQIFGGITRDASGNCRLLGSVSGASTTTLCDAGASTWSVAVTADSTNNRLAITVTGEAAKTIRWVASVEMAEVG